MQRENIGIYGWKTYSGKEEKDIEDVLTNSFGGETYATCICICICNICLYYIFFYLGLGFEETLIYIILIDVKMSTMIQPAIIVWFSITPAYIFFYNK